MAECSAGWRLLATEYAEPATLADWVVRLQWAVDAFTQVSGNDVWQRTDALGSIAQLGERGAGSTTVTLAEINDLVSDARVGSGPLPLTATVH
ncbi:MAG: hypothetical protein R2742_04175 [Micropruina glycogenica]